MEKRDQRFVPCFANTGIKVLSWVKTRCDGPAQVLCETDTKAALIRHTWHSVGEYLFRWESKGVYGESYVGLTPTKGEREDSKVGWRNIRCKASLRRCQPGWWAVPGQRMLVKGAPCQKARTYLQYPILFRRLLTAAQGAHVWLVHHLSGAEGGTANSVTSASAFGEGSEWCISVAFTHAHLELI